MLLGRHARLMLVSVFTQGGLAAVKAPGGYARSAKPVLDAAAPAVVKVVELAPIDQRPDDELLVEIAGWVEIVAGTAGRVPAARLDVARGVADPHDARRRPLLGERGRGGAADPAGRTSTADGDVDALSGRCRA